MRYGKVYFYDRMGNREPTDSDRVREALDTFEAPRFRPPEGAGILQKNYLTTSPLLDTPPDFNRPDPLLSRFPSDSDDAKLPITSAINESNLLTCPDVLNIPDDPVITNRRVYFNESANFDPFEARGRDFAEDLPLHQKGKTVAYSNEKGFDDMNSYHGENIGLNNTEFTKHMNEIMDGPSFSDDICYQCRLEEERMRIMKNKADQETHRHQRAQEKANLYESEIQRKEEEFQKAQEEQQKKLVKHVDKVNEEIIINHKRNCIKSPPMDYYIFRDNEESLKHDNALKKKQLDAILLKQIEEKKSKEKQDAHHELLLDISRNHEAAQEFARRRDLEDNRTRNNKEMWNRQLNYQIEQHKASRPIDDNWLWWAERPDEHGWRDARLKGKFDQVERNIHMKNSVQRLEKFVLDQKERDAKEREKKMERYSKLREKLHENSTLIFGDKSITLAREKRNVVQPNPQVEEAWRRAHEQNDKKYRILQEAPGASSSSAVQTTSTCRRCIRCTRPLNRSVTYQASKTERIY